jgi:hypothetical protein
MNTNRDKLVLRRQSIRTLTADELRFAQGGDGNRTITSSPTTNRTTIYTGTCIPTKPTTQTRTQAPTKA